MRSALGRHDAIMRAAVAAHGGHVFKTVGDAFCVVFADPVAAVRAAAAAQQALGAEAWPPEGAILARMALHTGLAELRDGDYFGPTLNRVARLLAAGHGGQVLVTAVTHDLLHGLLPADLALLDVGRHRFKDLDRPEQVYQLCASGLGTQFPPLRSVDLHPHNLPAQVTRFVGRDADVAALTRRLPDTPLVTLVGAGGAGKTRLALRVAEEVLGAFPDGVWFVPLAPLSDPAALPAAVAAVVGARDEPGRAPEDTVVDFLHGRRTLLLLDNCEHVAEAAARLVVAVLRACPDARVLATSREPLGVSGETTWPVPPLTPPAGPLEAGAAAATVQDLEHNEAVQLFVDRVQAVQPLFHLTPDNAEAVADICRRLDGIPLALELAAARMRALTVTQLRQRLDDRFRLLSGTAVGRPGEPRTLRATIDWSHDLLTGAERTLFRRLAVFRGGWTLEAAEAVCAGGEVEDWQILDVLAGLVAKSLVAVRHEARLPYYMLETLRAYAAERLDASGEADAVAGRHARWYADLVAAAEPELVGPHQESHLAQLVAEQENLAAAMGWAVAREPAIGLSLAGNLWRVWYLRGSVAVGRRLVEAQVAGAGPAADPTDLAKALHGLGSLIVEQGDLATGRQTLERALALWRALDEPVRLARTLNNLAWAAYEQGDYVSARGMFEESLERKRTEGDTRGIAVTLGNLGLVYSELGDLGTSQALYEEGLGLARQLDDSDLIAFLLFDLGQAATSRGDYEAATDLVRQSLALREHQGDRAAVAEARRFLGQIAHESGDMATAREHFAAALAEERRLGSQFGLAEALKEQARLDLAAGELDLARAGFAESLTIQNTIGHKRGRGRCLAGLARVALAEHDAATAAGHLAQCLALLDQVPALDLTLDVLSAIASLALQRGRADQAVQLLDGLAAVRRQAGMATPSFLQAEDRAIRASAGGQASPDTTAGGVGVATDVTAALQLARRVVEA